MVGRKIFVHVLRRIKPRAIDTLVHPIAKPGQCLLTQCFVLGALLTISLTGCRTSNISGADDAYDWESEYEPAATPEVDEDTVDEAWETYEKAHSIDEDVTENAWKAYDVVSAHVDTHPCDNWSYHPDRCLRPGSL